MSNELDIEVMKNLYDFGALIAYKVVYFDPITFQIVNHLYTFDEQCAKNTCESLVKQKLYFPKIESFMVKFNNAFAKKETV